MSETEVSAAREVNLELPSLEVVRTALKSVVDLELGTNVVDLGLLYGLEYRAGSELVITMTLTSAAGAMAKLFEEQVGRALEGIVGKWRLNWVWLPPWGPDRITDDGRNQMRALGLPQVPTEDRFPM